MSTAPTRRAVFLAVLSLTGCCQCPQRDVTRETTDSVGPPRPGEDLTWSPEGDSHRQACRFVRDLLDPIDIETKEDVRREGDAEFKDHVAKEGEVFEGPTYP